MELLKDKYYNELFYQRLAKQLRQCYPDLNQKKFCHAAINDLDSLELKQRITHTARLCAEYLPSQYTQALKILYKLSDIIVPDFSYIFMSEFVALFGRNHYKLSLKALQDFTQFSSSEFAIREFLMDDFDATMGYLNKWAEDQNYHVRRLASEGTRPRLPWARQVPQLIEKPQLAFPILEKLKIDVEKYVQKSVANHINDISKDHPDWITRKLKKWPQSKANCAWIIKHGMRGLIKTGHPAALSLIGIENSAEIKIQSFKLEKKSIKLGEYLSFSFVLVSASKDSQKLVIDYKIYYMKKNGSQVAKVFKLKILNIEPAQRQNFTKRHKFQNYTTRKHCSGKHMVELLINGRDIIKQTFELVVD